jgi:hypothetical protein
MPSTSRVYIVIFIFIKKKILFLLNRFVYKEATGAVFSTFLQMYDALYNISGANNNPSLNNFLRNSLESLSNLSFYYKAQLDYLRSLPASQIQNAFNFFAPQIPRRSSMDDYFVSSLKV